MRMLKPSSFEAATPILVPCARKETIFGKSDLYVKALFFTHGTRIGLAASKLDGFRVHMTVKLSHNNHITRCQQHFSRTTSKSVGEPIRDVLDAVNHLCKKAADTAVY